MFCLLRVDEWSEPGRRPEDRSAIGLSMAIKGTTEAWHDVVKPGSSRKLVAEVKINLIMACRVVAFKMTA